MKVALGNETETSAANLALSVYIQTRYNLEDYDSNIEENKVSISIFDLDGMHTYRSGQIQYS